MLPTENNINEIQNKIWYVIKNDDNIKENPTAIINSSMHELRLNDIIKLGRVKYVITELNLDFEKNKKKQKEKEKENNEINENNADNSLQQIPVFQLVSDFK